MQVLKRYRPKLTSGWQSSIAGNGYQLHRGPCSYRDDADADAVASQFARLLVEYQEHPEPKSLAPEGTDCKADTCGLLRRAHIVAGELRYVGKETDRKWEEGRDISVLDFAATEYGRSGRVIASDEIKGKIPRNWYKQMRSRKRI